VAWSIEKANPTNPTLSAQLQNSLDTTAMLRTGFLGPGFNLDAMLASLEQNQAVKVILNPRIATVHDRMARIDATDTLSYLKTETTTDQYGVPRVYTSVAQMAVPITLQVIPHVNPNQTVGLDVNIVSTAVTGAAEPGTAPPTTQQTAVTQLVVKSGETAVIGGLLRDQAEKGVDKVPLLGDLPWFLGGGLFRKETTRLSKVELVLFLMPRIVDDI
jgi:general secretion pathway protein D